MEPFNRAYSRVLAHGKLTVGLMTPVGRAHGEMADPDAELLAAMRADTFGFAALWTRDVPLMIPQGSDGEAAALDDPFVWLATLAGATSHIALGTAAAVLPLRDPLLLAKSAISLDRVSKGRFILGLGSGDREAEFAAFGVDAELRGALFRDRWATLRSALSPVPEEREALRELAGGFDLALPPAHRLPMLAVGSARQTLQWIAANADAWATYHRDEVKQQGRIGLWHSALKERAGGAAKPFIQSVQLDLCADADAAAEPIELGIRTGWRDLVDYLVRLEGQGVAHVILNLSRGARAAWDVLDELGSYALPALRVRQGEGCQDGADPDIG